MKRLTPLLALFFIGCAIRPQVPTSLPTAVNGLADEFIDADVAARVDPPLGWHTDPLKTSDRHQHQVWISPTGRTAYGVIHFSLPLPVGLDLVFWSFLREMKKREGEANLISKQFDDSIGGLRFVVEGGLYRMRISLVVDGFAGWAVYAGTLRATTIEPDELKLAEAARDGTVLGTGPK